MRIRNVKNKRKSSLTTIILGILFAVVTIHFGIVATQNNLLDTDDTNSTTQTIPTSESFFPREQGSPVLAQGTLISADNFPTYTHELLTAEGITYALLEADSNVQLNQYVGQEIKIVGEITMVINTLPIVTVSVASKNIRTTGIK